MRRALHAIGVEIGMELADVFAVEASVGDWLLLCCDGLWEMVADHDIQNIVANSSGPSQACRALVEAALKNGGQDNVTVLLAQFEGIDQAQKAQGEN